jgi:transposase
VILNKWFGLFRRAYNISVAIDQKVKKRDKETIQGIRTLMEEEDRTGKPRSWTNAFRNYINSQEKDADFVDKCPQNIRGHAVDQFLKAKRSTKAAETESSLKNTKRKKARFQFKSKKYDFQQSIVFDARDWSKPSGIVYTFFSKMKTKKEKLPPLGKLDSEVKVTLNKAGEYYFCVSKDMGARDISQTPNNHHSTAVLDPGVRTFQTVYDADGQGFEWGKDDMKKVFYLCRQADRLQSKISQRKTRRRGRAYHRILARIKNQVRDCHNKLALFLCENYRAILIPEFDTQRMIRRIDRKLHKKTVRSMCTWSHFSFRQILLQKAELFPWMKVAIVNEAYTSKTCGSCGHIHQKLGGNKTFCCPSCGNKADRDLHASRNILLRYLTREIGVVNDVFLNTSSSH